LNKNAIADNIIQAAQPLLIKDEDWKRAHPEWKILGAGGFGAVMHVSCPQLGHLAIKLMPRAYPRLMPVCVGAPHIWPTQGQDGSSGYHCPLGEIEFEINENTSPHANIGRAYGAYFGSEYIAIVTPGYMKEEGWVVLEDLRQASNIDRMEIALQLVRAVKSFHNAGIAHNDIKPANIMWNQVTRQLKVIDLGSASTLDSPMMFATVGYIPINMRSQTLQRRLGESTRAEFDTYAVAMTIWTVLAFTNAEISTAVRMDVHRQIEEARQENPDADFGLAEKQGDQQTLVGMSWEGNTPHRYGMYALFAGMKYAENWQIDSLMRPRTDANEVDLFNFTPIQDVWSSLLTEEYWNGYEMTEKYEEDWSMILGSFYGVELVLVETVLPKALTLDNGRRCGIDGLLTMLEMTFRGQAITDAVLRSVEPAGPGIFSILGAWLWMLIKFLIAIGIPAGIVFYVIKGSKGGEKALQHAMLEMRHNVDLQDFVAV
jgi:serine/threonine protein kinase